MLVIQHGVREIHTITMPSRPICLRTNWTIYTRGEWIRDFDEFAM